MKKKIMAALVMAALVVSAASCGGNNQPAATTTTAAETTAAAETTTTEAAATEAPETTEAEATEASETVAENESTEEVAVMSFDEFSAAELDTMVCVETYVQAKQGWWEDNGVGQASFYTQTDDHGAYFLYNMPCSQEEYEKLVPGTKIKVTGFKAEWSGETEITEAEFEIEDGNFVAEAEDVTALLGTDELESHKNEFVSFKGMTIAPIADADGKEANFLYNWDGSGEDGSDLYFKVTKDGQEFTFTVESYLCGPGTDVYEAVKGLKAGDVVDLEGFLYWYNGANPHITSVSAAQ